jgi:hypothetical protein
MGKMCNNTCKSHERLVIVLLFTLCNYDKSYNFTADRCKANLYNNKIEIFLLKFLGSGKKNFSSLLETLFLGMRLHVQIGNQQKYELPAGMTSTFEFKV